ncbi:multidrug resistance protein D [Variovorax sp. PBS-H4]|uniref:MFS transporter n=1 Tax=Variovorax sp. PBS-H4 TaxID=434008 RepID=UPI0013172919|nr:MFS transporter [Variovorax sp. PBS-H4]VTU28826.1 multidrug resistance protein D [Variovorax sp. PBS-H4]
MQTVPTAHPPFAAGWPSTRLGHGRALWLKASLLVSFLAASTAPSPLYALYREAWGFSALTLTVVFSSYSFALLSALLVFGSLSDHRGRREVILGALVLEFAATMLFWRADSVAWLLSARVLQGVATGIATGALSAGLLDLHRERGPLVNGVAPMVGMAAGAFGTSVLAQFAPSPTRLVFDLLMLVFALQMLAALYLPETVVRRPGAWRSLRPSIAIPPRARPMLWQVLPVNTAQWALGGFYLSLGPTLARVVTGNDAPLVGGSLIGVMVLGSAAAILAVRQWPPRRALAVGAAALTLGLVTSLAGIALHSTGAFFIGAAVAGLGFGSAFNGSLRSLVSLAAPHERAALMAGFYVLSYLAFSVPAIAAGLSTGFFGLPATAMGLGALLTLMALTALLMMIGRRTD